MWVRALPFALLMAPPAMAQTSDYGAWAKAQCTMTCVTTTRGRCPAEARQPGFFLPKTNAFPGQLRYDIYDMESGRVVVVAGSEGGRDTLKNSMLTLYEDGTAGLVETELMRDGTFFVVASRGSCTLEVEE